MTSLRLPTLIVAGASLALSATSAASAQRQQPSPEQRLERLEKQIAQIQRQVFPKGRPANTAGFADDPAATQSSVASLAQRLESLERQLADILRLSEENGNLLRGVQADMAKVRDDSDARLNSIERKLAEGLVGPPAATVTPPGTGGPGEPAAKPKPKPATPAVKSTADADAGTPPAAASDPGEDAYTVGFKQWEGGDFDGAIRTLRAFTAAFPAHRRVSFANNLIGRSLLDSGKAKAAAEVLLANYRKNPKGERAPDSLYYLGQALMKLGQPGQACKAYAELEAVYGAKVRPDLNTLVTNGKSEAQC